MELEEFLQQTQADVRAQISERLETTEDQRYPYPETIFAEVVMEHMAEIGMTYEPTACHYSAKVGNANLRLSGYSLSEDAEQLDLFVSLYEGVDQVTPVTDTETKTAAEQCLRFLARCAEGKLARTMDESNDAYELALTIEGGYSGLDEIRIYVVTDRQAKSKAFKPRDINGKTIKLEVMDIERLHRHWSEGKPRDELVVNFDDLAGGPLPCVYVPAQDEDYDYALTVIPGEALRFIYEKYGARLLEANVRSFLSITGKVNRGIRDTLKNSPSRFMAYNNGIVIVADEVSINRADDGSPGISSLKGMQIVNGGQTTASIYFSKKKSPEINLKQVRVPAKIIILRSQDGEAEEALISDISRYANSQNAVKQSDLSANKPYHVEIEKLAQGTYCPNGVGRWFYERTAGSYKTLLAREGTTPSKLKHLRTEVIPPARKITKTDLAKYLNAWDQKPYLVSLGAQKNFERYMDSIIPSDGQPATPLPDIATFKEMVAKAILFKKTHSIVRPMFPAFQANVAAYLVSLTAEKIGNRIVFERVWNQQDISSALKEQIATWAPEVNDALHSGAKGRMVSEWAKKPECWEAVRSASYSPVRDSIPELN